MGATTEYNREGTRDLPVFKTNGNEADPSPTTGGVTLANATTYYAPLGSQTTPAPAQTSLNSVHVKWDSAFVGVITIETCNFPERKGGVSIGAADVSNFDTTVGNWIQEDPPTAYISTKSTDGTTGGATVANATVTVAGGTAGGCMFHLGNLGARRTRVKLVSTTGGVVRISYTGKNAA